MQELAKSLKEKNEIGGEEGWFILVPKIRTGIDRLGPRQLSQHLLAGIQTHVTVSRDDPHQFSKQTTYR